MKKSLLSIVLIICSYISFAQNPKIDSLLTLLKIDTESTNRINHLNKLSWEYLNLGSCDSCILFANTALDLSQQLNPRYKKGIINAYNSLGSAYLRQSNYRRALDCHFKTLKLAEEIGDKNLIGRAMGNIGIIYTQQNDYTKALDYYFKALKIAEEIGFEQLEASTLANIGSVSYNQSDYTKALDYYFKAQKLYEALGLKYDIAINIGNIGNVYNDEKNYPKAIEYYFKALEMAEELGDKNGIAIHLANIGLFYNTQKKYKTAYDYLYRALALSDSIEVMSNAKEIYNILSTLYEKANISLQDSIGGKFLNMEQMRLRAMYYHKRYVAISDTIFSEENKKQLVQKEMNYEFDKKETAAKAEQDKKDAVATEEKQTQQTLIYSVLGFLLIGMIFSILLYKRFRLTNKQKHIIEQQKELVEEKQKEVMDSIRYASRIQRALITSEKYIASQLNRLMKN